MENGSAEKERWGFRGNEVLKTASSITIRGILNDVIENINQSDPRPTLLFGHGDPSAFPCFRTTQIADEAVTETLRSAKFNGYAPTVGILPARRAIADHLSKDLPYQLSPDDIFMTLGCIQAIEVILTALARPKANILLPRPGFPLYEARAAYSHLEVRHFDLLPEKGWEVDLEEVESLADKNTAAMVIINPGNPCGNVYTYKHLKKIVDCIKGFLNISPDPATFIQAAVPQILEKTSDVFFSKIVNILREAADICYERIKEIPCITCPSKPEGSMFAMAKLNLTLLEDIEDDIDFCVKMAKEESVVVLPGSAVGLKNWVRVSFAVEPSSLEEGFGRIKAFYLRHAKKQ